MTSQRRKTRWIVFALLLAGIILAAIFFTSFPSFHSELAPGVTNSEAPSGSSGTSGTGDRLPPPPTIDTTPPPPPPGPGK